MSEIRDSIETFKKLLDIEYEFVIAHKGKTVTLKLFFEKQHFFHLVGFQHLEDISGLFTESREIIFDKLDSENSESNECEIQ